MGAYAGPDISENGLVLALDAGNTKSYPGSGTTWTDLSGQGNTGTLTNGPTYSSSNGGSLSFDGVDDYVQCSGSIGPRNTGTFVAWIRTPTLSQFAGMLFSNGALYDAGISVFNGNLRYTWSYPGLGQGEFGSWNSGLTIPELTWCMCAVSVISSSATVYLCQSSGITSATNTKSHPSVTINNIRVGDDANNGGNFVGNIAIAQIYKRALTASEIQQNYNATKSRFGL